MKLKVLLSLALIAAFAVGCTTYPPNGTAITLTYPDGVAPEQVAPDEEVTDDLSADTRGSGTTTVRGLKVINDAQVGGTLNMATGVVFEGATDDTYETTLTVADPGADRTITFPNSSGTVALAAYADTIEMEGATANDYEAQLEFLDPTADVTVTVPTSVTAAVMVSSLTTNGIGAANSVTGASNGLVFEGSAGNAYETTLSATNPTADRAVVFADAAGTVVLSTLATNAPDAANSVTGASNAWVFEGATANDYETSFVPVDPTADRTVTIQNVTGVMALTTGIVLAKTETYNVAATDTGTLFKLSGSFTVNLPAAAAGLNFCFVNYDGGDQVIDFTDATDVAINEVNSPGDSVTNTTAFDNICLYAIDATNWATISSIGTWADGN